MDYNRIVAITGLPGLYEVISSKADGAVVRSLEDKSTKFVSSRIHNLSHLESIEVYTVRENVTLADVFNAMKAGNSKLPDVKDNKALKSYFEKVYPDLDFERVYASDLKKMVKWFEVLDQNQVDYTIKEQPEEVNEEAVTEEPVAETVADEAPAKKAAKSKAAKPKSTKAAEVTKTAEVKKTAEAKPKSAKTAEAKSKAKAEEEKPKKTGKKKTGE